MESSSPPWRVFDAPSGPVAAEQQGSRDTAAAGLAVQPTVLLAAGAAVLVGAIAVAIAIGGIGGEAAGPDASRGPTASDVVVGRDGQLVVDVAGAVVTPGLYRLDTGARVGDAIDAAGGFSNRVDAGRASRELNLAATVTDGQQIRVPSRDDPEGPAAGSGSGTGGGNSTGGLIDLNLATQSELESLPGIGPVTATKIIDARSQTPFASIDELRERGLVGEKTFDSIRALITVG